MHGWTGTNTNGKIKESTATALAATTYRNSTTPILLYLNNDVNKKMGDLSRCIKYMPAWGIDHTLESWAIDHWAYIYIYIEFSLHGRGHNGFSIHSLIIFHIETAVIMLIPISFGFGTCTLYHKTINWGQTSHA